MEILRDLFPKKEGKFNHLIEFSKVDIKFILNKDIIKAITLNFIGKEAKIYTKSDNFTQFNTYLSKLCNIFFIIITKSPRYTDRFWYLLLYRYQNPLKHIWGTLA